MSKRCSVTAEIVPCCAFSSLQLLVPTMNKAFSLFKSFLTSGVVLETFSPVHFIHILDEPDSQCVPDHLLDHGEVLLSGMPLQADKEQLDEDPSPPLPAWPSLLPGVQPASLFPDENHPSG
jgi:hypothetical protein